ncbi:Mini-chromosome maintenance complex-binding protein [Trichoplax sp. H2]|nr:Mini-chromosome maintenance complex-binding protein [Trichoplax sp. H2]|eukprot:RDD37980.1 Mini-chromosome maintenance complex-binding protein [Trichoplax sp. H2]
MPVFGESADWVKQPFSIIESIFEKSLTDGSTDYGQSKIIDHFGNLLCSPEAVKWVPSLNDTPIHRLPSNSLVKYRCMVQDMFDREFYLGVYEVHNEEVNTKVLKCGKYYDVARCPKNSSINLQSDRSVTLDRQVLYCVPIPGENQWAKDISYFVYQ